ncbi:MAG: EAL domain-containing protein [Nitrospiria bacterium]
MRSSRDSPLGDDPAPSARLNWPLLYFVLAGFDLLTVLLGLYLSHRITRIYADSVAVNHEWAAHLGTSDQLRGLAVAVNAPGNNVFDSRRPASERVAMQQARALFDRELTAVKSTLAQGAPRETAAGLLDDLAAIEGAVDSMSAEAALIFSYFERGETTKAGQRMATMDRKYGRVQHAFEQLNRHIREIQSAHFRDQLEAAAAVQRFEWTIGVLVLLMVAGATVYGRHLLKQSAAFTRKREEDRELRVRSEQRRADAEREAMEARFSNLLNIAADAIISVDQDQRIVLFNRGAEQTFGYRAEEVIGRPLSLLLPRDLESVHGEHIRRFAAESDTARQMGERRGVSGRRKDGAVFPAEVSISRIVHEGSTLFTAILRDVTERRRAEQAMEASEQRFRGLVDTMHGLVAEVAPDGAFQLVNQAFCLATGYAEAELIGSNFFAYLHEADHPRAAEQVRVLRDERRLIRNADYRFRTKAGTYCDLVTNGDPINDPAGDIQSIVLVCFDLTERKQAEATILRLAYYDPLTGLPNRALLHDRLTQVIQTAQRSQKPAAFLLMDLDHFKEINNTLGHQYGDRLLDQLGTRLQGLFREADTVARLGGDEFAVLLPDTDLEGALEVAEKIRAALTVPFMLETLSLAVEASLGIAIYPRHGAAADVIIQHANIAMYAAKHARSGQAVYASEQDHYSPKRLALMGELRYAIEHGELVLYYQPKIDVRSRRVIGLEALVRWKHPDRGLIPPDDFIPLAERTGLIRPLTRWVLETAHRQAGAWREAGYRLPIAVNLSVRSLHDASLPRQIAELAGDGTPWLELEITESTIMADPARALNVLEQLHRMRIPLAIDDFGTGYSSLAYLKRLPVTTIKIDKSFVKHMAEDANDAAIVRSTIELGHNLGLAVIAEGVETESIWNRLAEWDCDAAQGFYMGRPMPKEALAVWLNTSEWSGLRPPSSTSRAA